MACTKFKRQKILITAGCSIVDLSQGLILYWGNMTVYVFSYFLSCVDQTTAIQGPWILYINIAARTLAILLWSTIEKFIGKWWAAVVGMTFANLGVFLSYLSVQSSMVWMVLSLAVCFGFGTGLVHIWALKTMVYQSSKDNLGFLTAFPFMTAYAGAIIVNEFVTIYCNPLNLSPDLELAGSKYFTQKSVVDKVPNIFLILGVFTLVTQILGFILVKCNEDIPDSNQGENEQHASATEVNKQKENGGRITDYNSTKINSQDGSQIPQNNVSNNIPQTEQRVCTTMNPIESQSPVSSTMSPIQSQGDVTSSENEQTSFSEKQYTPMEALKSPTFYGLFVAYTFTKLPLTFVMNYYKLFGQLWIQDDYFLTLIGTFVAFFSIWSQLFWGTVMDKIGWKKVYLSVTFLMTHLTIWYYFTAMESKWLYVIVNVLFCNMSLSLLTSDFGLITSIFGKKHVTTIYGILRSPTMVLSFVEPFLIEAMVANLGWFYSYVILGLGTVINLVLFEVFLPNI